MKASHHSAGATPLLTLSGIQKRFGGVVALGGVDFELRAGEIHALLGENGAGKSTLMKVLSGLHRPDQGELKIDGRTVEIRNVSDAKKLGIRLIHQELALASNLTVAENLFLGQEPTRFGLLDRRQLVADAERLRDELGFPELGDVNARVSELNVARQQLIEITRALAGEVRILVLDEPTAALSHTESEALFIKLCQLRERGVGIIYISHRLEEIKRLADRITVLRDGHSVGTQAASQLNMQQLIQWMVGRTVMAHYPRPQSNPGNVALAVRDLHGPGVKGVNFELRAGEILGIAGIVGAGRTELAQVLSGITTATAGTMLVEGKSVRFRSPMEARAAGIALVPEDRKRQGLIMTQDVGFNLALPWTDRWSRGFLPDHTKRRGIIERAVTDLGIKTHSPTTRIGALSGGNQQKVVLGKWMESPPTILILDEPTRGVDVGAREEIFALLGQLVARGMAILLISSDLPEVLNLSHRLLLYRDGTVVGEGNSPEFTPESVMSTLAGSHHTPAFQPASL